MAKIIKSGRHEFILTDRVPTGHRIWNIGKNMARGYVPFVKVHGTTVDKKRMYAIKINGAQTIMSAVGYGPDTITGMKKYISKHGEDGRKRTAVNRIKKAIPIMKRIKGMK